MRSTLGCGALAATLTVTFAGQAIAEPSAAEIEAARNVEREIGAEIAMRMFGANPEPVAGEATEFGRELGDMAKRNVFGELWSRPGLDKCSRSLVTLSILLAVGQIDEFKIHVRAAVRNGCTVRQLEEVILQASAYAGFPAANRARKAAIEVLASDRLIN
jgi:4-carboxymuconolactone decarboxylase